MSMQATSVCAVAVIVIAFSFAGVLIILVFTVILAGAVVILDLTYRGVKQGQHNYCCLAV